MGLLIEFFAGSLAQSIISILAFLLFAGATVTYIWKSLVGEDNKISIKNMGAIRVRLQTNFGEYIKTMLLIFVIFVGVGIVGLLGFFEFLGQVVSFIAKEGMNFVKQKLRF